ncbi:MAG: glutamine-hydrolyzing carbamoyl-phosphate synthase small subunit, partial [Methanobacteriota archaeon]
MGTGFLVLEDGSVLEARSFGARATVFGELVFNTGMTGYQEALTDPSYRGQILMMTYPLIGNYGVSLDPARVESDRIQTRAFVVREACEAPSHPDAKKTVHEFLDEHGIPGLSDVDTRALTVKTRTYGTLKAAVTTDATSRADAAALVDEVKRMPFPDASNLVSEVSCKEPFSVGRGSPHVVLVDCGAKRNILRNLSARAKVTVVPWDTAAEELFALEPDGVFVSNGPGDPAHPEIRKHTVPTLRKVLGEGLPVAGICLGHQILALTYGAKTFKLKFGHRGANQPVLETETGRVYITSQNHGFAV